MQNKFQKEGLTFDDVLLLPSYSEVLPHMVSVDTYLSHNIRMKTPIISAAMDTVTEYQLAISIAQQGGMGVIHKNMSIEQQAIQVRKVKRSESGLIKDPLFLYDNSTVGDALILMNENSIGGIPIIDKNNTLKGIVTNRDLRFEKDKSKDIKEVMTSKNLITSKSSDLQEAEKTLQKYKIEKLLIIDDNDKLSGLITYRDIIKVKEFPNSSKDKQGRLIVAAAVGVGEESKYRIDKLVEAEVDAIVIDTAHGHSQGVVNILSYLKSKYPQICAIVGNIATGEAAKYLADKGADVVKVGIGPGSICTTRIVTGVGVPQLTALSDVYQALKNTNVKIIADGGIKYSGDIVKAIAAGADCVMLGSMFAGCEEAPGETIIYQGRKFKEYRGMGSLEAMKKGSKDRYFQSEIDNNKLVPEGITGRVAYKGKLEEVYTQMIGGLRAGMGYCGTKNIDELKTNSKFIKISNASLKENHPHNIAITREAPNYSAE